MFFLISHKIIKLIFAFYIQISKWIENYFIFNSTKSLTKNMKLPSHIAVCLSEEYAENHLQQLTKIILWSVEANIPMITLYDMCGILKKKFKILLNSITESTKYNKFDEFEKVTINLICGQESAQITLQLDTKRMVEFGGHYLDKYTVQILSFESCGKPHICKKVVQMQQLNHHKELTNDLILNHIKGIKTSSFKYSFLRWIY